LRTAFNCEIQFRGGYKNNIMKGTIKMDNKKSLDNVMEIIQNNTDTKNKPDAMALYYAYLQHPWDDKFYRLPIGEAAEYLNISADRVRKARKILIDLEIIVPRTFNDEQGIYHLIELKK